MLNTQFCRKITCRKFLWSCRKLPAGKPILQEIPVTLLGMYLQENHLQEIPVSLPAFAGNDLQENNFCRMFLRICRRSMQGVDLQEFSQNLQEVDAGS